MKKIFVLLVIAIASGDAFTQTVNWRLLDEDRPNRLQLNFGYDYAATTEIGYSRSFAWFLPTVAELDYSFPMGSDLLDDFKIRLGGQMELFETGGFSTSIKIASLFRRYETQFVRIVSFGSDFSLTAGFYTSSWFAAGEFGFDKAIVSDLKHSDIMKSIYPGIRDGWFLPTGGHFYYGVQGGVSVLENLDISMRLGATNAQDHDENAAIPYYAQLGLGIRF